MRISCPFCGSRDSAEFSYLGDASVTRPDTAIGGLESNAAMYEYLYLRDNPAGLIREYWYHGEGCHSWLMVERDTRTHAIANVFMPTAETLR